MLVSNRASNELFGINLGRDALIDSPKYINTAKMSNVIYREIIRCIILQINPVIFILY